MGEARDSQQKGQLSHDALTILTEEWKLCEAGIARFDTLSFQVRGWAISFVLAIVAAAVSLSTPKMAWIGVLGALLFWWVEAMHKGYQGIYISRVQAIQRVLCQHIEKKVNDSGVSEPMIAQCFHNAWEGLGWKNARTTFSIAFYINVCATYLSLMVVCGAFALIASGSRPS